MFGLSQLQERLISLGVLALVVVGFMFHERHIGAKECVQNVAKSNEAEQQRETVQRGKDEGTVQKEGKDFETAKTEPIAPAPVITLGVCPDVHHKASTTAPAASSGHNGEAPLRADDTGLPTTVQWNTEPVVRAGHDADAQITGLQDYITTVCRPK